MTLVGCDQNNFEARTQHHSAAPTAAVGGFNGPQPSVRLRSAEERPRETRAWEKASMWPKMLTQSNAKKTKVRTFQTTLQPDRLAGAA